MRSLIFSFLFLLLNGPEVYGVQSIRLNSRELAIEIDPTNASVTNIDNKLTGDSKNLRSVAFRLTTTRGEVSPRDCQMVRSTHDGSSAKFIFLGKGLEIEVGYRVDGRNAGHVRKFLTVTNREKERVTLFRVVMFDWTVPDQWPSGYPHSYYPNGVNQIQFHRSGIWSDHSINLFLRDESGGLFLGVENPFFEANYHSLRKVYPTRIEISYRPRWNLASGESFEGDAGFLGVYRQEKVYLVSPSRTYFGGRERMQFEILDWGEVWAMQKYMRSIMPPSETPDGQYYMTYWGYADPGRLGRISAKKTRGEPLTKEEQAILTHFGGGPFPFREKEIWYRLTPETVEFYKQVVDDAAFLGHYQTLVIPALMAGHKGWFTSAEEKKETASVKQLADVWFDSPAFPLWQEVADYAAKKGLGMFSYELARISHRGFPYRGDRPQWKYLTAEGKRTRTNCYANPRYVQWYTRQLDKAFSTHPIRHLQWDEGWMAGIFRGDDHCYDEAHGHPSGNVSYHQFRYILSTLGTLKSRHPTIRLLVITGAVRGMPWIMKHLDDGSHTGAMMDRLGENAAWFEHNIYFLPSYKSHREGSIHWILERGSAGVEPQPTSNWYTMLTDPEAKSAYKQRWDRWVSWTNQHRKYLQVRRDLFLNTDSSSGLRGTAHMLGDRGYIFLHNAGKETLAGQIPVNRWLGLETGKKFRIKQTYPNSHDYGVYLRGEDLTISVEPRQTLILHVEPTHSCPNKHTLEVPPGVPVQKAFLNLDEVIRLFDAADFWPAGSLPGKDNMPKF